MSHQTYVLTFDSEDAGASAGRSSMPENRIFDTEEELLRGLKEIHEGELGPLEPGDATVEVSSVDMGDVDPDIPPGEMPPGEMPPGEVPAGEVPPGEVPAKETTLIVKEVDASVILSRGAVLEEDLSRSADARAW